MAASVPEPLRLPAPHLTLNTAPHTQPPANQTTYTAASYVPQTQSALSLPPLVPGVRAMATVYPTATAATFAPQLPLLANNGANMGPSPATSTTLSTPGNVTPQTYVPGMYGTPTKRTSPISGLAPAAYATSSPMAES